MEDKRIEKADFSKEQLEEHYYQCTFEKCNFAEQTIGRVMFEQCTFNECNFSLVKTNNTSWLNALFTGCKMTGIDFSGSNRFGISLKFKDCLLSYALFTEMKLQGTSFTNCDLQNADFMETDLSKSTFTKCNLQNVLFYHTKLEGSDFSTAINYNLNPVTNSMKNAKFSRYSLEGLLDSLGIIIID